MAVTVKVDVYLSVADADAYWSARNNSTWAAASTAAKEKALLEATQYIDANYSFIGSHTGLSSYPLAWPRYDAEVLRGNLAGMIYDSDEIPPQVEAACAELALDALSARLQPAEDKGGAVKRQKAGPVEVEYQEWAPTGKSRDFVTGLLKDLLKAAPGNIALTRA